VRTRIRKLRLQESEYLHHVESTLAALERFTECRSLTLDRAFPIDSYDSVYARLDDPHFMPQLEFIRLTESASVEDVTSELRIFEYDRIAGTNVNRFRVTHGPKATTTNSAPPAPRLVGVELNTAIVVPPAP
jgi:hypothetical protein